MGKTGKYNPSCMGNANAESKLFQYCPPGEPILKVYFLEIDNVCIMTKVGIYDEKKFYCIHIGSK